MKLLLVFLAVGVSGCGWQKEQFESQYEKACKEEGHFFIKVSTGIFRCARCYFERIK